jgi:hypothetical protein
MQVVISPEAAHPYVAWLPTDAGGHLVYERERIR